MGGLADHGEIHFTDPSIAATVGDPVAFGLEVKWSGGVTDDFMGGVRIQAYRAEVKRQASSFLLKNPEVVTNRGTQMMPFDLRISVPDGSSLKVAPEWDLNPQGRQTLSNFRFYTANSRGSTTITAEAVDEQGSVVTSDHMQVSTSRFVLALTQYSTQALKVGDSCAPALVIALPGPKSFSTVDRLSLTTIVPSDLKQLQFSDMQMFGSDGSAIEVPFNLYLTVVPDHDGINPVFFKYPDPLHDVSAAGDALYDTGLPDYVVGRRYSEPLTEAVVSLQILVKPGWEESYEAAPNQSFKIRILPHKVALDFQPLGGGTDLVLEDDWRADEGKLRGSFLITATVGGRVVYRSDERAEVSGAYTSGMLAIQGVCRGQGGAGDGALDRFHPSTQLTLTIDDPQVAEFDATHLDPSPGTFNVLAEVTDWISATGPGVANLSCRFEPYDISDPSKIPPDLVFWDLPKQAAKLVIDVKPPLRAHLERWSDLYFNGNTAVPLDHGNPLEELIYSSGTLAATVDNHNPDSQQQIIKVIVEPPSGQTSETPIRAGQEIDASGDVHVDVEGLDYDLDADDGANRVSLSAWKPINEVMDGGPDVVTVTLKTVAPNPVEILEPADGITVRKRRIDNVRYRYGRAYLARVTDFSSPMAEDSHETYVPQTRDSGPVNLSPTPGDHSVYFLAYNDFSGAGEVYDEITIHAPAPSISVDLTLPADKSIEPNRVGFTVPSADATVNATNAVTVEIWKDGNRLTTLTMASGAGAALTEQRATSLPPQGHGDLEVGDNTFEFRAINEFATTSTQITINKRARLFEPLSGSNVTYEARPAPGHGSETVLVGVTARFDDHTFEDSAEWWVSVPFDSSADKGFLHWEHTDVTTQVRSNGGFEDVETLIIYRSGVLMTGPDFQTIAMVFSPDPSWVVNDPDTQESDLSGLYTSVVIDPAMTGGEDLIVTLVDLDANPPREIDGNGNPL